MHRIRNRVVLVTAIFVIVAAISGLVIVSPFALRVIASNSKLNWPELSNIGQTYGAVSALLSALALAGVAASILMQNRELRHNRWVAGRSQHYELMRMALDDPFYRQVFSALEAGAPEEETRLVGYINMIFGFWLMMWEFGDWSERQIRICLLDILGSDAGRSYWRKYGSQRMSWGGTKRERAFDRIADEIYRELENRTQGEIAVASSHAPRWRSKRILQGIGCVIWIVGACVALLTWKRKRKNVNQ